MTIDSGKSKICKSYNYRKMRKIKQQNNKTKDNV